MAGNTDPSKTPVPCAKHINLSLTIPERPKISLLLAYSSYIVPICHKLNSGSTTFNVLRYIRLSENSLLRVFVNEPLKYFLQVLFLIKDLTMKTSSQITHLTAKIMSSDLKIKSFEQTEYSHATILMTIGLLSVNESVIILSIADKTCSTL